MKAALLLVIIGALAAPSFSWSVPSLSQILSAPADLAIESGKAIAEKAKAEVDKLLSQGNKEKAAKLINVTIVTIKKSLETILEMPNVVPGVLEIQDAVGKTIDALDGLKAKAQEAAKQGNVEKATAALQEIMSKVISLIKNIFKQQSPEAPAAVPVAPPLPLEIVESASLAAIKEAQKGALAAITSGLKTSEKILAEAGAHSDLAKAVIGVRDRLGWVHFNTVQLFSQAIEKHEATFNSLRE